MNQKNDNPEEIEEYSDLEQEEEQSTVEVRPHHDRTVTWAPQGVITPEEFKTKYNGDLNLLKKAIESERKVKPIDITIPPEPERIVGFKVNGFKVDDEVKSVDDKIEIEDCHIKPPETVTTRSSFIDFVMAKNAKLVIKFGKKHFISIEDAREIDEEGKFLPISIDKYPNTWYGEDKYINKLKNSIKDKYTEDKLKEVYEPEIIENLETLIDKITGNLLREYPIIIDEVKKKTDGADSSIILEHADIILSEIDVVTLTDTGEMFMFDKELGYWTPKVENHIKMYCSNKGELGDKLSSNINNIKVAIQGKTLLKNIDSKIFKPPRNKINAANGVVNILTRELEPHSNKYYFVNKLEDIPFIKDAPEPTEFLKFLKMSLPDEKSRDLLLEWFGFNISDETAKTLLFPIGSIDSGKTTLFEVLMVKLLGGDINIDSSTLDDISDTKSRAVAYAKNKKAIIDGDVEKRFVKDISVIKKIAGGSNMMSDKKYEGRETSVLTAKMTFCGNNMPILSKTVRDDSWWWANVMVLRFHVNVKQILEKEGKLKKDRNELYEKVYKSEMSGLLNLAIDGLNRYLKQGFTYDKEDTYNLWFEGEIIEEDSLTNFIKEWLVFDGEGSVTARLFDAMYETYCKSHNEVRVSNKEIGNWMKDEHIKRIKPTNKFTGKQEITYLGIKPSPNYATNIKPVDYSSIPNKVMEKLNKLTEQPTGDKLSSIREEIIFEITTNITQRMEVLDRIDASVKTYFMMKGWDYANSIFVTPPHLKVDTYSGIDISA